MTKQGNDFFQPVSAMELARFAGVPTFMRLPCMTPDHPRYSEVQIGLVGVPWDGGTTNRPGARHGPRQLRDSSTMIRAMNPVTGVNPFSSANCADLGDVSPNPVDIHDSLDRITAFYANLKANEITPHDGRRRPFGNAAILHALAAAAPLGLIQFDSHTDLFDSYFGGHKFTHGTPFPAQSRKGL